MTPLQNRLVLHRFACREFGYCGLDAMLDRLRGIPAGLDSAGESEYARALYLNPDRDRARVTPARLAEYDSNIVAHSRRLRMTGEHGRDWKPHQYLALVFTEHYLRRWFDDPDSLRTALDKVKFGDPLTRRMPDYTADDLRTVAFQSATGSGKTLLMHAHILQYRHYLGRAGGRLNNIVLVTPNERMSEQHAREMRDSGLSARLFSSEASADLLAPVEIIDVNKLAARKGVKRVAVADFGENNLVLVDEGHLGASGKVWRERRGELSRGGFTFEYSATFNQIASDGELLNAYGKSVLFDYPYRTFHRDGYGKDYAILNLPGGAQDSNSDMYLLGCLLTFYQQCRLWRDRAALWKEFNPAKPLWVFLGRTVTGSGKADRATRSDVARILSFLAWVLARGEEVRHMIAALLAGRSGLLTESGADYFAERFPRLPRNGEDLYADLCETLFHGAGRLHIACPAATDGELHLRTADNPPFGIVNVGDSAGLRKLLAGLPDSDFDLSQERGFVEPLFSGVDRADSTVNLVIGARRFIAGWNSWRVSTMGLMHVGVGEGPEIIQMFGRGVRLKGWNMSLKRHRECPCDPPEDSDGLAALETLHVFGLRAGYMQTFRDLLAAEGVPTERETIDLPVTWNFPRETGLKTIRLEKGARYENSDERPMLPGPGEPESPTVTMDLYSRLHAVASADGAAEPTPVRTAVKIPKGCVAFFDRARIYDRLLARKRRAGWSNLTIAPETVDRLLDNQRWFTLFMPPERLEVRRFEDVRELEEIAIDLIADYADRFWRKRRRRWEHRRIEVAALDETHPNNIGAYHLSVDAREARLAEDVREMASLLRDGPVRHLKLDVIMAAAHAYMPLLHARPGCEIDVRPVALDGAEKTVVEKLAALARTNDPCLRGRDLFLIRNLTRGRGLSFFDDHAYYPDFILWLKDDACQHMVFLDPKGLVRYGSAERDKVRLHTGIRDVEARVRERDPNLRLHAYVLSVTPPGQIGAAPRPQNEWERHGVYFLQDPDCLAKVVEHALAAFPGG